MGEEGRGRWRRGGEEVEEEDSSKISQKHDSVCLGPYMCQPRHTR